MEGWRKDARHEPIIVDLEALVPKEHLLRKIEKVMAEEAEEQPLHREGYRGGTWVLLDYGCIAVHVFNAEAREFYGLERLWRDGKPVDISGVVTPNE